MEFCGPTVIGSGVVVTKVEFIGGVEGLLVTFEMVGLIEVTVALGSPVVVYPVTVEELFVTLAGGVLELLKILGPAVGRVEIFIAALIVELSEDGLVDVGVLLEGGLDVMVGRDVVVVVGAMVGTDVASS